MSHILLKQPLVSLCHTSTDKEFLHLSALVSNPSFSLGDLIRATGGGDDLLRYHEERRSYPQVIAREAEYERTMEGLKNGEFYYCALVKLEAQAFVENHERNRRVSDEIHAKHQAGTYGQMQIRDLDITGEWDKFVWLNCENFPADQLATLTRVTVFQQLNGDGIEFDSSVEDVGSEPGESVYSDDEMN